VLLSVPVIAFVTSSTFESIDSMPLIRAIFVVPLVFLFFRISGYTESVRLSFAELTFESLFWTFR
jgi:hypothetical protein